MDGFRYVDIFSTKGIEYLMVLVFLVMFMVMLRQLRRPFKTANVIPAPATGSVGRENWFELSEGFLYHPGHSWARDDGDQLMTVGMDDFAQKLLGEPGAIELPKVGSRVEQGAVGWRMNVDDTSIEMLSPVGGEVVAINQDVVDSPGLVNNDPYGNAWLMKIRVPESSNVKNLLSGRFARAWMEESVHSLREVMAGDLGVVMQDGGIPVSGFARNLAEEGWEEIAAEFLMTK